MQFNCNNLKSFLIINLIILLRICVQSQQETKNSDSDIENNGDEILTDFLNLSNTTKPCDNFYEFVCDELHSGRYVMQLNIESDLRELLTLPSNVTDEINFNVKEDRDQSSDQPISIDSNQDNDHGSLRRKLQMFYNSCLNLPFGLQDKLNLLENDLNKFGNFPGLSNFTWKIENFDIIKSIGFLEKFNIDGFFRFRIRKSPRNDQKLLLSIEPSDTITSMLSEDDLENLKVKQKYNQEIQNDIRNALKFLNIKNYENITEEIVKFEMKIAKLQESSDLIPTFNEMTYNEFKLKFQRFFNWDAFFKIAYNVEFNGNQMLIVENEQILLKIFHHVHVTDPSVIAHHLLLRFIENFRPNSCLNKMREFMPDAISLLYVEKYLDENSVKNVQEMFYQMIKTFKEIIKDTNWMDQKTKFLAIEKIENITPVIGYYENYTKIDDLNDQYKDLKLKLENNYYENQMEIFKFKTEKIFNELLNVKNADDKFQFNKNFDFDTTLVWSNYEFSTNTIRILGGLIRKPFYDNNKISKSFLWGGFGSYVAHEIAHTLDPQCIRYDSKGNLLPSDTGYSWLFNKTAQKFYNDKLQCFIEQYDILTKSEEIFGIGKRTLNENFATNLGLEISLRSYTKWLEKQIQLNGVEKIVRSEQIPKLNNTNYHWYNEPLKLFFIGFSHFYCDYDNRNLLLSKYVHSQDYVNGPIQNNKKFSELFQCPIGAYMNPIKKCQVF